MILLFQLGDHKNIQFHRDHNENDWNVILKRMDNMNRYNLSSGLHKLANSY